MTLSSKRLVALQELSMCMYAARGVPITRANPRAGYGACLGHVLTVGIRTVTSPEC
jgi:hypothetical protein